ncbi:hypothetical protein GALMADRAFT_214050 [Galerina marginata CBS 339.88]|uniref:XPG-I domain-containing protein n=1 Tax=Galerina marginata (strain CBS 339.88) TaxID=685588 RepID=A0A067SJG0_GALM3|nr:hypothetical protein GALMADRAFT_214050 [Galerina marginata CBS 339.88]
MEISQAVNPNEASSPGTPPTPISDAVIDPQLLNQPTPFAEFIPARTENGNKVPEAVYQQHLKAYKRRSALQAACSHFGIRYATRANLDWLRAALVRHWYPYPSVQPSPPHSGPPLQPSPTPPKATALEPRLSAAIEADIVDDAALEEEYDTQISGEDGDTISMAQEVFGALDTGGLEDMDEDEEDGEDLNLHDDVDFAKFQTNIRVSAAQKFESNRRAGGRKTQQSVVRSWNVFLQQAIAKGQIRDAIVDEHSLLVYIEFSANRCRRNQRGEDIPNTRIAASQIKKEFFGALGIRKVQDAKDPTLALKRPAMTVHVYDAVKTGMDEALRNAPDDAPDIVANTFLHQISEEVMTKIHYGFLQHRVLKSAINGHLAWTMMNASGNRGDDIRALRLCEMQPWTFLHPNNETRVFSVLGLQSDMEQKARAKAMRTTVNPRYTCFIAHRNPELCPIGALAIYLHYIHDVVKIDIKYNIDYMVNKSWRAVRLFHGSLATVSYNPSALHNLFVQAYKEADIDLRMKQHLARHSLGYFQEKMGVEAEDTARLGWSSRDTYLNYYAPSIPKKAILAAHEYKIHEVYHPAWTDVEVPEAFLSLVCPMAESNIEIVKGRPDKTGAENYWNMGIPSTISFSGGRGALSVLARKDVEQWMKTVFPLQLESLKAVQGIPESLEKIQNEVLRKAIEQLRHETEMQREVIRDLTRQVALLNVQFKHRTSQWTPAKAPPYPTASQVITERPSLETFTSAASQITLASSQDPLSTPPRTIVDLSSTGIDPETRASEDTGMYVGIDQSLCGFAVPSPQSGGLSRPRTSIDLVLPPMLAFCAPGKDIYPLEPIFGKESVQWAAVFEKIKRPGLLWDVWSPSKSLEQMSIEEVWHCYNVGEALHDKTGIQTGMKPPLRLVEQKFLASWRNGAQERKNWSRFREIPDWIDGQIRERKLTPAQAIVELENMRQPKDGKRNLLGTNALSALLADHRKKAAKKVKDAGMNSTESISSSAPTTTVESEKKRRRRQLADEENTRSRSLPSQDNLIYILYPSIPVLQSPLPWVLMGCGSPAAETYALQELAIIEGLKRRKHTFFVGVDTDQPVFMGQAPGEAEAELAKLNELGIIDAILTMDSDAFAFGARCVIRSMTLADRKKAKLHSEEMKIYMADFIEHTNDVPLSRGGILLLALTLGGDYDSGIEGCGPAIAHGLARCGFGDLLLEAGQTLDEDAFELFRQKWLQDFKNEFTMNTKGCLSTRQPKLALNIPETFPERSTVNFLKNNLWEGVFLQLIYTQNATYSPDKSVLETPFLQVDIIKSHLKEHRVQRELRLGLWNRVTFSTEPFNSEFKKAFPDFFSSGSRSDDEAQTVWVPTSILPNPMVTAKRFRRKATDLPGPSNPITQEPSR